MTAPDPKAQTYLAAARAQVDEQRAAEAEWHRASVEADLARVDPRDLPLLAALVRLQDSGVVFPAGTVRPRAGVLVRAAGVQDEGVHAAEAGPLATEEARPAPAPGLQGASDSEPGCPDVGINPGAPRGLGGNEGQNGGDGNEGDIVWGRDVPWSEPEYLGPIPMVIMPLHGNEDGGAR